MNKILAELKRGDKFEIIGCESSYRNLFVKQITESCACIGGQKLHEGVWHNIPTNYTITTGVAVNQLEGKVEIVENKEKNQADSPALDVVVPKGNRGRKPKNITLPEGEFTVTQVTELNQVSQPCANIHVNALVERGVLIVSRTVQGRGKPKRYFVRAVQSVDGAKLDVNVNTSVEVPAPTQVAEVVSPAVAHSEPVVAA